MAPTHGEKRVCVSGIQKLLFCRKETLRNLTKVVSTLTEIDTVHWACQVVVRGRQIGGGGARMFTVLLLLM